MDLKEIAKLIILQVDHNRDCGKEDCFTVDEVADIIDRRVNNVVSDDVIKRAFYAGRERESYPDWDFIFQEYEDYLKWKDHPRYKKYGLQH